MGAGGCLGPKKNKDEIYTKLIKQMHDQPYKLLHTDPRNLDIYQTIKQKITKKGSLKKFVDNLSTRRHKILESLNFNYKLTSQAKEMQRHYVGLIITDAVMDIVYPPESRISEIEEAEKDREDSDNSSNMNESLSKKAQNSRKHMMKFEPERRLDLNQQNQVVYDEQYFRLVVYLFEHEKKMHYRVLQSLTIFCSKHTGYIQCEQLVWKTIERLTGNIKKNVYLSQSCLLFNLLLHMTKDEACEQLRNHDTLISVIRIWLVQKQSLDMETSDIQMNCLQIIKMHFQRCICSWYSHFLYEVIFIIYDSIEFNRVDQALLEKMYEQILENLDLHSNFLRGLFNYLLCYLSVTHEAYVTEGDKKWFSGSLNMSYQKIRSQYRNILKDHVKVECFRLVNSWISKKYIIIDEFCLYSNKALIYVYLSNSKYYRNTSMMSHILEEYFKILARLNLPNRVLFVERLVEDIRDGSFAVVEYEVLIRLMRETVYRNLLKDYEEADYSGQLQGKSKVDGGSQIGSEERCCLLGVYLVSVSTKYSHESNLEILKLVGYLMQNRNQLLLNEESRSKICEFMHSLYCYILIQTDTLYSKYEFVCAALSLCRILAYQATNQFNSKPAHATFALNLFLHRIVAEAMNEEQNISFSLYSQYMLAYMIEQLKCMTSRGSKFVTELTAINNRIISEHKPTMKDNDKDVAEQMVSFVQAYYQELPMAQIDLKEQKFSGDLYQQYKSIYAKLFAVLKGRDSANLNFVNKFELSRKTSRDSQSFSAYSAHSRNSRMCQKCREMWEKNNTKDALNKPCTHLNMKKNWRSSDISFQEVMDIVHI